MTDKEFKGMCDLQKLKMSRSGLKKLKPYTKLDSGIFITNIGGGDLYHVYNGGIIKATKIA